MRHRSVRALGWAAAAACLAGLIWSAVLIWNRATLPAHVQEFDWQQDWPEFGGWSGLEVSGDGTRFTVLSDGSALATGTFARQDGRLTGIAADFHGFLSEIDRLEPENRKIRDAEGLAVDRHGRVWASFERRTRVEPFTSTGARLGRAPRIPKFMRNKTNSGLEALAITQGGHLLAIPERSGARDKPFPVYRYAFGTWDIAAHLPRDRGWLMVGADVGADGLLYTLERRFIWGSFASRIRRFALDTPTKHEILYQSPPGRHGNLEGLAVWQDAHGLRLTMIGDDNLNRIQRGGFVEVTLSK